MAPTGTKQPALQQSTLEIEPGLAAPPMVELNGDWSSPPPSSSGRRLPVMRTLLLVLLAVVVIGGLVFYRSITRRAPEADIQMFVVARRSFPIVLKERGELKAANSIDVRSELEGRATIIYLIAEGQRVEKGDLLIELASDEIDDKLRDEESKEAKANSDYEAAVKTRDIQRDEDASKIRKAQLQLRLAQLAEQKYIEGEKKEAEQDATLAVDKANMVLQREEQDFKDAQELFEQGFITRVELKDAEFNHYAAGQDVLKYKLALEVLNKYTVPMDLESKASDVHEAEKELDRTRKAAEANEAKATADVDAKKSELAIVRERLTKLRDQKAKSKIIAPAAGLVVYARENSWRSETTIETGVEVHERQLLIQLPDTSSMKAEVRVHEAQIERLSVGMFAQIAVEGFANQMFPGKVSKIAVMADSQNYFLNPNLREYKTDVLLDGSFMHGGPDLKPNTTARVEIQIAQLHNVLAVPVQAVFAKGGKFYVFKEESPGVVKPVQVEPGLSSTEFVEIKTGLTEGQSIRLSVTDDMRLLLPDDGDKEKTEDEATPRRTTRPPVVPKAASRPAGERPAGERSAGDKPAGADKPPGDNKPAATDKPAGSSGGSGAPDGNRRPRGTGGGGGDRPRRSPERGGATDSQPAK